LHENAFLASSDQTHTPKAYHLSVTNERNEIETLREAEPFVMRQHPATMAVLLNYRTPNAAVEAVRALHISNLPESAVIVVDNASCDGSADLLARELPNARLIVADANGGFSAGSNLGIREALRVGAHRVLLLNPDVIVPPGAVEALEHALDADPQLGIVGPVLVSRADPNCMESMGMSYSDTTGRMRHRGYGARLSSLAPFQHQNVDGLSGCAMLIKREVLEKVGLLTEEYFFGFEDLDFCLRARAAGYRSACVGTTTVQHEGHLSIGRTSGRRIYFATRNHLLLAHRCSRSQMFPARWLQTSMILALNLAHVLFTSTVPRGQGLRGFANGARDHFAGRYGDGPLQRSIPPGSARR
jgi:GT2 family glycosyltransferase